jgi:hypothetical protein
MDMVVYLGPVNLFIYKILGFVPTRGYVTAKLLYYKYTDRIIR